MQTMQMTTMPVTANKQARNVNSVIPEQFTAKAHSALFGGGVSHKKGGTIIPVYS